MKKIILYLCLIFLFTACFTSSSEEKDINTSNSDTIKEIEEILPVGNIFYVDNSAIDDNGSGEKDNPKKYISSALKLMSSGDNLIIEDGIYIGENNMINTHTGIIPPSGINKSHPTTIIARNIGKVIIDGEYQRFPFHNAYQANPANFLHIDGIHFRRGKTGVFAIRGSYNKVTNCGFEDGMSPDDNGQYPIAYISGGSDHILIEDCWVWGKGRYGLYFQSSYGGVKNSIIRRCVIRQDDAGDGPYAGINFYNSRPNSVQNCFVLDSNIDNPINEVMGAFSMVANDSLGQNGNNVLGSMALNNKQYSGFFPSASSDEDIMLVNDCVFWNNGNEENGRHGAQLTSTDKGTYNLTNITSGYNAGSGFRSNTNYAGVMNINNSISVYNNKYGFEAIDSADKIIGFGNKLGLQYNSLLNNSLEFNPINSSLKYLIKTEDNENSSIGATIMYKIGGTNTFYGESAWDSISNEKLWPLNNEKIWSEKIKSYIASGSGGDRGFAALSAETETPLTDYIWEYLGNNKPNNLYE